MTVLTLFEKKHNGGILRGMFDQGSSAPFSFWFTKGEVNKISPLYEKLAQCWKWLDNGMKLDNKTII